ncbi:MAG: branched-chain amino acid transport system ATP-binding protein [Frankiales bacterium]|jgi:branched-chain amino acid transport system ATP-binding protein|nr:branched-chain amino acid transport system ATP-binding protein [Frankiales bacterium]MDX6268457.1 branched-chain amino acid transport system ATP-binding protein [Frankiales bacterium]
MGLTVSSLQVAYGGVVAVRDVSLSVQPGQITAVLGANGAGKTTTLLGISGLVRARGGHVEFEGTSLLGLAPERIARLGIAHVPAGRGIFPGLTVADNLRMGLYGAGRDGDTEAVEEVLEAFPILRERRTQAAGTMSGGQQQQLAIGRALVQRPKLLMLDEMSMGLSPTVVTDLFALVRRLADGGMAVVMVEQFVGQALKVADQAVVIEQGTVAAAGAPSELSAEDIGAAYLGSDSAAKLPGAPRDARQDVPVSLAGVDVRKLERLAAQQGRSADEVAQDLLEKALGA